MAPDPDHLIERAAARLRTAHGLVVPDQVMPDQVRPDHVGPDHVGRDAGSSGPATAPVRPPASGVVLRSPAPDAEALATVSKTAPDSIAIPGAPGSSAATTFPSAGSSARPTAPSSLPSAPLPAPGLISLGDLRRIGLVVTDSTRNRVSEEYRIISDRLRRASMNADRLTRNLVMITSARQGEGKSFTALNLAASIAYGRAGRALLVDADIGPNALTLQLGFKERPGLHDLICDATLRPDPFVLETEIPGLYFLPMGHPARVRNGTLPFGAALERLGRRYVDSVIVLDTPPALSTSDPHAISPHVAQAVLVVEAERTQRGEVEAALDLVRACPSVSAVLNKTRLSASHTFGARDDHYYAAPA